MFKYFVILKIDFILNLKTSFNEFDQAHNAVKQGQYWGVAAIRSNFTQAVINKYVFLLKFYLFDFLLKD